MEITRFADARRYDAPKHFDMRSLRLQGFDLTASKFAWVGLSHFLPQGGAEMDASVDEVQHAVEDVRPRHQHHARADRDQTQ